MSVVFAHKQTATLEREIEVAGVIRNDELTSCICQELDRTVLGSW